MDVKITAADVYYTISGRRRAELKVKGSRFTATVFPTKSKDEALSKLDEIRKEFYDATHNCYAYRLGFKGLDFRAADDGEPSGSAGKPILFMLQKYDVSDALLVVTRYFGGVKLGVGGLSRAYSECAAMALELIEKIPVYRTTSLRVLCVYEDISIVKPIIERFGVDYIADYRDVAEFVVSVPQSAVDDCSKAITVATNARAGAIIV